MKDRHNGQAQPDVSALRPQKESGATLVLPTVLRGIQQEIQAQFAIVRAMESRPRGDKRSRCRYA